MDDFRKSINNIIYERLTSPFLGTLTTTWLIWNWKIVYLTFFVSESKIVTTKIEYITSNFSDPSILIYGPLISTIGLLTVVPFLSNGSFWLSELFKKWRIDKRNEIERKQLLTIEQSIALREEVRNQEERFEKILANKDQEINILKSEIDELRKASSKKPRREPTPPRQDDEIKIDEEEIKKEFEILKNKAMLGDFAKVVKLIQSGRNLKQTNTPPETSSIGFLEANNIVQNDGTGQLSWTKKGQLFYKNYIDSLTK